LENKTEQSTMQKTNCNNGVFTTSLIDDYLMTI